MISSEVRTIDGVALSVRAEAATGEPRDVAVVVAHGFGASKDEPRVDAVARALRDAGFCTVTYDARGHGASGGASTLGVLERHDVAAAADVARELAPRVVLVGASMGGIAVLGHAAGRDDVAGIVTVSCPAAWTLPRNSRGVLAAAMTQTRFGRSFARRRMAVHIARGVDRGEPPCVVARSVRAPIAIVHGAVDPFIGVDAATQLAEQAGGPARITVVPGLAHAFDPAPVASVQVLDAVEWLLDA
jgi:pimeloyl-ACP methyl ester carboxylesterase